MDSFGMVMIFVGAVLLVTSLIKPKPPKFDFETDEEANDDKEFSNIFNVFRILKAATGAVFLIIGLGLYIIFRVV